MTVLKKLLAITGAVLISYVILTSVMTGDASAPAAVSAHSAEEPTESGYTVAAHDGRVAIFRGDILLRVTDTPIESLPKADRVRLYDGITVDSEKELKRMIEDLCS